ncbi:DUF4221 family protein [Cyclobacterium lianum]|nr:DUF4221 family protein [Cyclobacterium lianum]
MIRRNLFYLTWFFFLISCKDHRNLDQNAREFSPKLTLIANDTLTFSVGSQFNVHTRYVRKCLIKNKPYLGAVNEISNDLEFFALSEEGENFKVNFQLDGPNGVGKLKAFEIISDSTLLIASTYRIRLYVTDFDGNLLRTIKTNEIERKGKPFVQTYYTHQPLIHDKRSDSFYVYTGVDTDFRGPGIWSGTMFLKMPNEIDSPPKHVFELSSYFNDFVYGAFFSHNSHVLMENRYLVMSIPFYNNILIYNLEREEVKEMEAGSKHFGDALPWDSPSFGRDEEFYVSSNSYREVAYDDDNKLLYRMAYRAVEYVGPDGDRRNWDNKLPSVIIINKDFEKVGEIDLPENTVYTRTYFTHNGKLYLSLNHPDNNPSEDQMVFVGFKPEEL